MKLRRSLAVAAAVLGWWTLPLGLGYLLLRKWARFVLALIFQFLGMALIHMTLGTEAMRWAAGIAILVVWADTIRLAVAEWRRLRSAA